MLLQNWLDAILTNVSNVMWEKFASKRSCLCHAWCVAKFHDFGVLALFCDLVACRVKNENQGFAKLAGLNPHKCLQSDVEEVWKKKELILAWLAQSQVP